MILDEFLVAANYRISDGADYQWKCYGTNARFITIADIGGQEVAECVYDTHSFNVYEVSVYDNELIHYSWRDPNHIDSYLAECFSRNIDPLVAYDDVPTKVVNDEKEILNLMSAYVNKVCAQATEPAPALVASDDLVEYQVTLTVKQVVGTKAKSADEAAQIAKQWYSNVKLQQDPWPDTFCWEDQYVSKIKVKYDA